MKRAVVVGATGLIGRQIVQKLIADEHYEKIKIFVRRPAGYLSSKIDEYVVNFDDIEIWKQNLTGDELYSALGTTIRKAGSKEKQYKVDFTYQYLAAKEASINGIKKYLLVSSAGANSKSGNFYLKTKGELEESVSMLPFEKTFIIRPSLLLGNRDEYRLGEKIGERLLVPIIKFLPFLKKYRPINDYTVAQAMINCANKDMNEKNLVLTLDEIFSVA